MFSNLILNFCICRCLSSERLSGSQFGWTKNFGTASAMVYSYYGQFVEFCCKPFLWNCLWRQIWKQ